MEQRAQFPGGEVVQGTEAFVEFNGSEATEAVERTEIVCGGVLLLCGVALYTAGDQVAEGIAAELDARDDMVEALHEDGDTGRRQHNFHD
jgi:hypothetical protein